VFAAANATCLGTAIESCKAKLPNAEVDRIPKNVLPKVNSEVSINVAAVQSQMTIVMHEHDGRSQSSVRHQVDV
jgi:hypothetical protein